MYSKQKLRPSGRRSVRKLMSRPSKRPNLLWRKSSRRSEKRTAKASHQRKTKRRRSGRKFQVEKRVLRLIVRWFCLSWLLSMYSLFVVVACHCIVYIPSFPCFRIASTARNDITYITPLITFDDHYSAILSNIFMLFLFAGSR